MPQTQYVHAKCPRCGEQLTYDGGSKKALKCSNCRYSRALGRTTDQVDYHPLTGGIQWKSFARGLDLEVQEYKCGGCKALIATHGATPLSNCPFCSGELTKTDPQAARNFTPFGIIPFTISQQQAREKLTAFLRNLFIPPSLKQQVLESDAFKGIYVPMFYVDALTRSTWTAEIMLRYMKPSKGKVEQKEAWDKTSGYYEHFFENQTRYLTRGAHGNTFKKLLPYNLKKVAPFDPIYLQKWPTEVYQKREGDEIKAIEKEMDKHIESEAKKRSRGEKVKDLKLKSEKHLIAMRHILVPLWVVPYRYQGKNYQYLVNGQNGKLVGDRPLSTIRIIVAVAATLVLLSLLTAILT